jgi:predicted MFS family arabinose efflux permease
LGTTDVLRQRDFRLLFSGQTISLFGDGMVRVALPFAVLGIGGSASDLGLVLAAQMLPLLASLLAGGVIADRTSPRAVMVAADLTRVASQGATATLLITGGAAVWSLAALAGLTGAATGFFNPASTGLLPAVVAPEHLQRANGLRATAMAGGEIVGPVVAGILVATVGVGWAMAIDAGTFAASAGFLARLRLPARLARDPVSFFGDLREGWRAFRARTWVWAFVAAVAVVNTLWGAWSILGPVVAKRDLGGAAAWGTILAAMGAGGLAGGVIAIRTRPRRPLVVATLTIVLASVPLGLLAAGAGVVLLALGALLSGGALMLGNTVWESTLQRHVPPESLSRVSAYDWFGSMAFRPLGLAVWGPVAGAIGISVSLWLSFALLLAAALVPLAVRDIRQLAT